MAELIIGTARLVLIQGDITRQDADAVVNPANPALLGGGGVDGAIHRAGGPGILEECRRIRELRGDLPTGDAVSTTGGRLPARRVIHTVGPVWNGGMRREEEDLARAYRSCLLLAEREHLRSIAFPSISTGAYGFPVERAAPIALDAVIGHLRTHEYPAEVRFVLFSARDAEIYERALAAHATEGAAP